MSRPTRRSAAVWLLLAAPSLAQVSLEDDLRRARDELEPAATPAPEVVDRLVAAAGERLRAGDLASAVATLDKAAGLAHRAGATGRSFELSLATAEALRQGGQSREAARRFRHAALQNPRDPRAAKAHRAACDALAPLMADADDALLEDYSRLLAEHLDTWPDAESAAPIRGRRRRVLAVAQQWQALLAELRRPPAPSEADAQLLVAAHEGLLRESPTIERLNAAQADLYPLFLAGDPPDWPDRWTPVGREAALVLATAALGRAPDWDDWAQKLAGIAARGVPAPEAGWRRRAAAVEAVAALSANDTEAASDALSRAGVAADTVRAQLLQATADRLADAEGATAVSSEARRLAESLAALSDPQAAVGATAMADAGRRAEALVIAKALADQRPDDRAAQAAYARLLAAGDDPAEQEQALDRWRQIEGRATRATDPWYEARFARIELLGRLGRPDDARKLAALTRLLARPTAGSEAAKRLRDLPR